MQDFEFKGMKLTESDMLEIKEHYELQTIADFIRSEHEDWSEEKIQTIAILASENTDAFGNEDIDIAIDTYNEEYGDSLELE